MPYEPLHHKYRPQTFADLVGQEAIATTLINAIRTARIAPAYLFTGPRGTGKTSSARILAKSLNCLKENKPTEQPCGVCEVCKGIVNGSALDVIELDAASNTGVDNIRELIERAQFAPVQCRYKVYVIDECHMLSVSAFNSLLKTLEEPPDRVVFVLATTDSQRVLPTIISRCQRFDFRRIPLDAMVQHLRKIASIENINIAPDAVQLVAQVSQGGLRDAESLLDQLSLSSGQVAVERVWDLVGSCSEPDLLKLLQAIAQNNPEAVLDCARKVMDRGREPLTILQNLAGFCRDLLIAKTAPRRNDLVACTSTTWKELCEEAKDMDIPSILALTSHLAKSEAQIKTTTQPRLWLEVALLGLLSATNSTQPVSVPEQRQFDRRGEPQRQVDARITTAQQQNITSNGISQPQQTPDHSSAAAENLQPPDQLESSPIIDESYPTSPPIPKPAEVEDSPSISQSVRANSAADTPREQIWQQVLAHLQPNSTQALLRQMGHLIEFDGTVVRIGMKSQAWCNLAKNYLPNIKAAFEETFKSEVTVGLELATPTQTKNAPINELPAPSTGNAPTIAPQIADSFTSHFATTPVQPGITAESTPASNLELLTPTADQDEDEVVISAQRLADFFKGEVVAFSPDIAPDSENPTSLPIATSAPDWEADEIDF